MTRYIGLIDGKPGAYGARIPDFRGCYGAGATVEAAHEDVTRALAEFASDMVREGEQIPQPRDLDDIRAALAASGEPDGIAIFVPLLLEKGMTVRANISLDRGLLEQIDEAAKRAGLTRSSFITSAVKDKITFGA
jgi:predicted RNase H-like HicB family nuclease